MLRVLGICGERAMHVLERGAFPTPGRWSGALPSIAGVEEDFAYGEGHIILYYMLQSTLINRHEVGPAPCLQLQMLRRTSPMGKDIT